MIPAKLTGLALQEGCEIARAGNGRSAAKGLETGLCDFSGRFVHLNVEANDIATGWGTDETSSYIGRLAVEGADIARVRVVVNQ
jgi:hypothetical protein